MRNPFWDMKKGIGNPLRSNPPTKTESKNNQIKTQKPNVPRVTPLHPQPYGRYIRGNTHITNITPTTELTREINIDSTQSCTYVQFQENLRSYGDVPSTSTKPTPLRNGTYTIPQPNSTQLAGTSTYVRNQDTPQIMTKSKFPATPTHSNYPIGADDTQRSGTRNTITGNNTNPEQSTRHPHNQDIASQLAYTTRHKRETPVKGRQKTRK